MFFTLNEHELNITYGEKKMSEEELGNLEIEKDKKFKVIMNILPEREDAEEDTTLFFKNDQSIKISSFPMITIVMTLPPGYPSSELPSIKIVSQFYENYAWQILH